MYSTLFRKAVFPVMEAYQGTSIQKSLTFLNKSQWWTREELDNYQNKKLRALIRHAYDNVPYYNRLFKENNLKPEDIKTKDDLHKIPYITKDIIRKNLPDLMAKNIPKNQFMKRHSSGSTGEPITYYTDKGAYSGGWAQTFRCWGWAGYKIGDPYVKVMIHRRDNTIKKLQDDLLRCTYVSTQDIKNGDYSTQLDKIKKIRENVIIRGYSSWLYLLAEYIQQNNLQHIKAKAVMTTGEPLYPHFRKKIESVFQCNLFDGYGGEEIPVAFECENHNGYHLCEETTVAEFLKNDEKVSSGELGEIVLTSLDNYAMPFIRYQIRDMGIPTEEQCNCNRGLATIKSIVGRDTDIVSTPDGKHIVGMYFVALFEDLDSLNQFQVIQETSSKLRIKLVKKETFSEKDMEYIQTALRQTLGPEMEISLEFVEDIPNLKSGKKRVVMSNVKPKFD